MVRIRHGWLVAALALSVNAGACKKDEKPATPAASTKAGDTPAAAPAGKAEAAAAAPAAGAADDLSLLPVDSELVMGLNFGQLQGSALWKKFVEPQLLKGDAQAKLGEFKTKCGFDPMSSVAGVSVGMKGLGGDKPDGVVVVHGLPKAQMMGCIDKMKDEASKDGATLTNDNGVITMVKDGETVVFTFVNDTTLLGMMGPGASAAGLQAAAKGGSALKSSPAFVEMYGKIKTGDSLWLLMNGSSKVFDQAASMGFKPKAVFGSINVTDGLALDMRARLESADQATQLAGMVKGQVGQFEKMVDKLEIGADAADLKINVALSSAKLEGLMAQFGGMLGGM